MSGKNKQPDMASLDWEEGMAKDCGVNESVPEWVQEEIKATWNAARDANGQVASYQIIERMVDRLGYGRLTNNPPLN